MLELVLTCAQKKLGEPGPRIRRGGVRCRPIPGLVRRGFEPLSKFEADAGEVVDQRVSRVARQDRIPRRVGSFERDRRG